MSSAGQDVAWSLVASGVWSLMSPEQTSAVETFGEFTNVNEDACGRLFVNDGKMVNIQNASNLLW